MPKLIFGCGYLGSRVANSWRLAGETVYTVTRSPEKAERLAAAGLFPLVADISRSETPFNPNPTEPGRFCHDGIIDTVLFAVGFDGSAGQSIGQVYVTGLKHVLDSLPGSVSRIIYISSTGVYGSKEGDWVTEETPCIPTREGGKACLAAEELLQSHALGKRAIILRMAGLYGPGRIPRRDDILAGRSIAVPSEGYLNLIHVDDAAAVVIATERYAKPPALFLVSDGAPVPRRDYYAELARLLGAPEPRFEAAASDSPAAQRASADKRIRNDWLRREIPFDLAYPTFREGLAAIVDTSTQVNAPIN